MTHKIRFITAALSEKEYNTLLFASQELQKYLHEVLDEEFPILPSVSYDVNEKDALWLGINLSDSIPEVEDKELDDAIIIDTDYLSGTISATNVRAVLIAVYRFLKEHGYAFLHPGKNGEYFPETIENKKIYVCEKASYRHRGICIEGSVYQEYLSEMIDWLPKAGMNEYYVQFLLPRVFFDRYYEGDSLFRDKTHFSDDDILSFISVAEYEMKKRSLLFHAVGHGWTCRLFGIDGTSWETHPEPDEKYKSILALVKGKRALFEGVPINTHLCYSQPKVIDQITDNVVSYCKSHPNISYLHFTLADGLNNNCECENCRKKRTSDYYVMMLNEIDRKLEIEGLNTKIVFAIYVDLLWKPIYERLKNNKRFVLMFAPIFRSYSYSFDPTLVGEIKPYEVNNLEFPVDIGENMAYLRDWQKDFRCDSLDFDYHFMWDHYYDFSQYNHAKVVSQDIKNLEKIGLNGFISCQIQRSFLPTSLNMNVLTQTLWNKDAEFEQISDNVLSVEFGTNYKLVQGYLSKLSDFSCAKAIRGEEEMVSPKNAENITRSIAIVNDFLPKIKNEIASENDDKIVSAWEKLEFHAKLYLEMLEVYLEVANGNEVRKCDKVREIAMGGEMRFKNEFDAMHFMDTFETRTIPKIHGEFVGV